ncbi:MAG TPA: thiolase family protein, partial [Planctomycetota bacterium]|nr:thiolase family protein [Planctomycetota bacterium]
MSEAVLVSAARTAMGKGRKGSLRGVRPDELAATVLREVVERTNGLNLEDVDDVLLGCAMPEGEQGMNVARIASLLAGLPTSTPAATINRFCSSGLQTIAMAVDAIRSDRADVIIAGGVESMSRVAMLSRSHANPRFAEDWPEVYLGMGLTAENLARKYAITREEADEFSFESHRKAIAAIEEGRYRDEIVPVHVETRAPDKDGEIVSRSFDFEVDECPRRDTTLEGLSQLRPVFHARGTVTAGNASQMSDGAAAVLLVAEETARALGLKPRAVMRSFAVAGVPPEIMGIGPVEAVPRALAQAGLSLDDMDVIELNEAFAVQALAVARLLEIPKEKLNP